MHAPLCVIFLIHLLVRTALASSCELITTWEPVILTIPEAPPNEEFFDPTFLACTVKNENFEEASLYLSHNSPNDSHSLVRFFDEFKDMNDVFCLNWFIESLGPPQQEIVSDNLLCHARIVCVVRYVEFMYQEHSRVLLIEDSMQRSVAALVINSEHVRATVLVKTIFAFTEEADHFFCSLLKSLLRMDRNLLKLYLFLMHLYNNFGKLYEKFVGRLVRGMNTPLDPIGIKSCETLVENLIGFSSINDDHYTCAIKASNCDSGSILVKHLWRELVEERFAKYGSSELEIYKRCYDGECEQTAEEFVAGLRSLADIRAGWLRKKATSIKARLDKYGILPFVLNQIIAEYLVSLL